MRGSIDLKLWGFVRARVTFEGGVGIKDDPSFLDARTTSLHYARLSDVETETRSASRDDGMNDGM